MENSWLEFLSRLREVHSKANLEVSVFVLYFMCMLQITHMIPSHHDKCAQIGYDVIYYVYCISSPCPVCYWLHGYINTHMYAQAVRLPIALLTICHPWRNSEFRLLLYNTLNLLCVMLQTSEKHTRCLFTCLTMHMFVWFHDLWLITHGFVLSVPSSHL